MQENQVLDEMIDEMIDFYSQHKKLAHTAIRPIIIYIYKIAIYHKNKYPNIYK